MTLRDIANNIPKKMGKTKAQIFKELCAACDGVNERTIRFWFTGQTEIPSKQLCDKLKRYLETYDISAGEEVFAEEIKALDELAGRRYRIEEPKEGHPRYHAEYPPHILLPEDIEKYEISFPTRELLDYYSAVAMSDGDRGAGAVLYCGSGKDQLENARKIACLRQIEDNGSKKFACEFWSGQIPALDHFPEDPLDVPDGVMRNVVTACLNETEGERRRPEISCEELVEAVKAEKEFVQKNKTSKVAAAIYFVPFSFESWLDSTITGRKKGTPVLAAVVSNFAKNAVEEKVFSNQIDRKVARLTEDSEALGYTQEANRAVDRLFAMRVRDDLPDAKNPVNQALKEELERTMADLRAKNRFMQERYRVKYIVSSPEGLTAEAEDLLHWNETHECGSADKIAFRSYLTEFPESFADLALLKMAKNARKKKSAAMKEAFENWLC